MSEKEREQESTGSGQDPKEEPGRIGRRRLLQSAAVLAAGGTAQAAQPRGRRSTPEPAPGARDALKRGVDYLAKMQLRDGSWQQYPGISALAVLAVTAAADTKHPAVEHGVKFLVGMSKPNGAIYDDRELARALPNYNTALCLAALQAVGDTAHRDVLRKAQAYLAQTQFDESRDVARSNPAYGGIGYGSRVDRPDLSNLQQALEALKATDYDANAPLWEQAVVFLQRCQNRKESNDQAWAGTDGGFIYASSGESKAEDHRSYASMTYAGLKSYLYCGVKRTDPRVQAAWNWLRGHYSVSENPGMGDAGLFYHYHTMSKTLLVLNEKEVTDLRGNRHRWSADMAAALVHRQAKDGSWVNRNQRWWEDNPQLVTAYALIALARCVQGAEA